MKAFWINLLKPKPFYAKWLVFLTLAGTLVLGAMGHLDVVKSYLDTELLTFRVGAYSISLYSVLRALLTLALIFWITTIAVEEAEQRIKKVRLIKRATRILLAKVVQIGIYAVAFLFALNILGVDLTALAVFSGAVGIGLGFGLQKIASNFISGLILLLERSVEQDDLIELSDGTLGFVRRTGARYTLVETFDMKEILVPNEDLITSRVTNWTLSNTKGRVEISVGVSYNSDIEKAKSLMLEAAQEHPLCIADPAPACYLRNFGDSSVDFILHFWIADITGGRWILQSEVMFTIWNKFKDNAIEIPFPQRDLHIRTTDLPKALANA